jgi:hypothetical protein
MLDKLNAFARHAVIGALPVVAAGLLTLIPGLQKQYAGDAFIGLLLTMATLYLTPLTNQYGVNKKAS